MDKKLLINVVLGALIALAIGAILNKLFFHNLIAKIGKKEVASYENVDDDDYETIEDDEI
jgi:uncharacterized membrane protein YraQ (UPF0718 family)